MENLADFRKVPESLETIIKPEELVDIVEMTSLTLQDRRIYNLLIGNAWNTIFERKQHEIARSELTRHVDSKNQDIAASLRRLMAAIVVVKIRNNASGRPSTRQVQLLGPNDIEQNGPIQYNFPPELIKIIRDTQVFARLHTKVMFELSSKYSLTLYEFLQRRKNLQFIHEETLTVTEVRGLLGVAPNKLKAFGHLNDKAIQPSAREVSFLTDYEIRAEPLKTGRAVTHVRFSWSQKTDVGAQIAAVEELERSKVGRQARIRSEVVSIADNCPEHSGRADLGARTITSPQKSDSSASEPRRRISKAMLAQGRDIARDAGTGWDIYAIAEQFHAFIDHKIEQKQPPRNFEAAWIGFVQKKVQRAP